MPTLAGLPLCHAAGVRAASAVLAAGVLGGCMTPPVQDAALQRALQGTWCNSNDGGRSCWAWDEFDANGRFSACGRTDDDPRPFAGTGRVTVSGRRMCYVVETASGSFWLQPGQRYCTDIVAIDGSRHRYRDIDSGAEFTLYRRERGERRCP